MSLPTDCDAYYRPLAPGVYQPSIHTQGAWQPDEQHMAPASGLLTHALEAHEPRDDLQIARISFDILGMIHAVPTTVTTRTLRPGRTIELIEATASAGGRDVVRATAWRLLRQDTSAAAADEADPMPGPQAFARWSGMEIWGGGYIASLELRADTEAGLPRPGRARVWLRTDHALVEGEPSSDLARYLGLVDTANGIAVRAEPSSWLFPNTDLSVHLYRQPVGPWVGLDTRVSWGPSGVGLTATALHDERGPVGRAAQTLTLRPR